ncbi:MAG: HAD family hydrolase [candidate division Zixibacteria bacterium]|nr:HAD family hydrolase [candidate division Zixibacteria bacterium]
MTEKAIFFDRDGTIMVEKGFLADPAGVVLIEGAVEALKLATSLGYRLFVVSNQSGVARGLMTEADVKAVNNRLIELLQTEGVILDGLYYCPHHPDYTGPCDCRKPKRGMVDRALAQHEISLADSYVIGDCRSDMKLAFNIGAGSVMVKTGYGAEVCDQFGEDRCPDHVADDILAAVEWIAQNE